MSEELRPIEPNNPGFDTAEINAKAVAIFIVVTVVMLVAVIGGVQFYFNSIHEQELFEKVETPVAKMEGRRAPIIAEADRERQDPGASSN